MWIAGILLCVLCVTAATFYEFGRSAVLREQMVEAHKRRCSECGAVPKPTLIHVSGCEHGWPPNLPSPLFEQWEEPSKVIK